MHELADRHELIRAWLDNGLYGPTIPFLAIVRAVQTGISAANMGD
jgi:hypothetical protein